MKIGIHRNENPFNPSLQVDQIGLDKGPIFFVIVNILIGSPSNKKPGTTPKGKSLFNLSM